MSSRCAKSQFDFEDPRSSTDEVIDLDGEIAITVPVEYCDWQDNFTSLAAVEMTGNELVEVLDRLIEERDGK